MTNIQLTRIIDCCIDALAALTHDMQIDAIVEMIADCDTDDKARFALCNAIDDALATDAINDSHLIDRLTDARTRL